MLVVSAGQEISVPMMTTLVMTMMMPVVKNPPFCGHSGAPAVLAPFLVLFIMTSLSYLQQTLAPLLPTVAVAAVAAMAEVVLTMTTKEVKGQGQEARSRQLQR
jgi:hypothetical protein